MNRADARRAALFILPPSSLPVLAPGRMPAAPGRIDLPRGPSTDGGAGRDARGNAMFERRLKIFLGFLCAITLVLVVRAMQVQVVQRDRWRKAAAETMKRSQLIETVRGRLLDRHGNVIAEDEACVDACVDYRALTDPPDANWVNDRAADRLRARMGDEFSKAPKARRRAMVEQEAQAVRDDIKGMWAGLAEVAPLPVEQVQEARQTIVQRVE